MNKSKISDLDICVLITYLLKSFILINGINILVNLNHSDSIISIIIGSSIGIITVFFLKQKNFDIFLNIDHCVFYIKFTYQLLSFVIFL